MRIKKIEINHFKGLYGKYELDLSRNGNNLMLYGENGSGKSSFAKALKLFFQSSEEEIHISDYENIFIKEAEQNTGYIKIIFGEAGNRRSDQPFVLDNSHYKQTEPYIYKANKIKGFLDYKSLLKTHFLDTTEVNVFDLLVNNLLSDLTNPQTSNTLLSDWRKLSLFVKDRRTRKYE